MVNAVLPLYLFQLGFSPLAFGLFDGAYQGVTGLLRIFGGIVADRTSRYKEVAGLGYAISVVCKLGLLISQAWLFTTAVLLADRTGKGVRTAPRDALISLSAPPERLAEAYAVHRTWDTAGALLGPVVAFILLSRTGDSYDSVFVTSFLVGLIGLAALGLFVRNRQPVRRTGASAASWKTAAGLLRGRPFRRLASVAALVGVVTVSDSFIYLVLSRQADVPTRPFPLLFVGTALAYLLLAVPVGRLADRVGRVPVFVAGHLLLAAAYLGVLRAGPGTIPVLLVLGLLGAYYACTDGVLMAMTSAALPEDQRGSGLAVLTTLNGTTKFAASVTFGVLWTWFGAETALSLFLAALVLALPTLVGLLTRKREAV
jgi:MFS family permease